MEETKTLAELLALPAGAELDAAVANALGDDLKARDNADIDRAWGLLEYPQYAPTAERLVWNFGQGVKTCLFKPTNAQHEKYGSRGRSPLLRLMWYEREGQEWQADIEAAVVAYRRPAPPYSTDGNAMLELGRMMRERGFEISYSSPSVSDEDAKYNRHWCQFDKGASTWHGCWGNSECVARARAALTALLADCSGYNKLPR